jgi:hypothetical protein
MKEQIIKLIEKHLTDGLASYDIIEGKCFECPAFKVTTTYKYNESIKDSEGKAKLIPRTKIIECILIEIATPDKENEDVFNYTNGTKYIQNYYDLSNFEKKLMKEKED